LFNLRRSPALWQGAPQQAAFFGLFMQCLPMAAVFSSGGGAPIMQLFI
jgi:hypothetical protein